MRKQLLQLAMLFFGMITFAQTPLGFNYQTVIRDTNGDVLANQAIGFELQLLEDSSSGVPIYTETHTATSNVQGVAAFVIGQGSTTDDFTSIDWTNHTYYLQVAVDITGGATYTTIGTSQLQSVPYALQTAKTSQLEGGSDGQILSTDGSGTVSWIDGINSLDTSLQELSSGLEQFNLEVIGDTGTIFSRLVLIDVKENHAYGYDTTTGEFIVIDVSNKYAPILRTQLVTRINIGSSSAKSAGVIVGNYVYVYSGDGFLAIINITDPTQPTLVSNTTVIDSEVEAITSDGSYLYLVDNSDDKEFVVMDINNPENPMLLPNTVSALDIDNNDTSMVINNGYVYVMSNETDTTDIINITDPTNPSLVVSSNIFGYYLTDIITEGDYLYVLDEDESLLKIFDITTPAVPTSVGTLSIGNNPLSIVTSGNYVYITDNDADDLKVVNVSDPANPNLVADIALSFNATAVRVLDSYAFVKSDEGSGDALKVVNLFNSATLGVGFDGTFQTVQDKDEQNLTSASLSGNTLTIEIENGDPATVNLSSLEDDLGNHVATTNIQTSGNYISNDGDDEGVFIDTNGKVGIGLANPTYQFQVYGEGQGRFENSTNGRYFLINPGSASIDHYNGSFNINRFSDTDIVLGLGGGKVGIGNNVSPAYQLDVTGTGRFTDVLTIGNYTLPTTDGSSGQVLTTNGTGVVSWSDASENIFEVSNSVVLPNTSVVSISNDDFVFGSISLTDDSGTSNDNHKFFFDKSKAAFRAGAVLDDRWDDANRGYFSFAVGDRTEASSDFTIAIGSTAKATAIYATAIGSAAEAQANNSVAIGSGAIAYSFGETAIGKHNTTYSPNSTTAWNENDRLFVIGNGENAISRSNALVILKNGDVGIGDSTPDVALDVVGDINYTGTIADVSDRRLKENFKPIDDVLVKIMAIEGLSYTMKDDDKKVREYGVIAQDVQKVFPEMVKVIEKEEGYLGVSYTQLIPVLLEAIKEQQKEIESLQSKVDKIDQLEAMVSEFINKRNINSVKAE
ncbi:tail fiber domain-containing protein [Aquimarina sp. 2201CG5-10]|uniref:tail fiber domain-containing protein n=1 Tax=Aquimarina callyspongiae TaxID=3098150 RepID=UPI002AB4A7ED|nr:tail fiber domain-containing protein [Aquimarina sp. 2201CG5-10]MDY8137943.1 tail fiber domain-containing protein [Aquimarina sp. 2201CG5-10]